MPFGFDLMISTRIVSVFFDTDNLKENVAQLGERLKIGGSDVGHKLTAGVSSLSFRVLDLFRGRSNNADSLVQEATSDDPDLAANVEICDAINRGGASAAELIGGIRRRIAMWWIPAAQYLSLLLLDTVVKNCDTAFSDVAAGRILDEMVRLIEDPRTAISNRDKALMMIESWGNSSSELHYLPLAYEQTYKSLKSRGIHFPCRKSVEAYGSKVRGFSAEHTVEVFDVARNSVELMHTILSSSPQQEAIQDEMTVVLLQQCRESQHTVQRIIETTGNIESLLFEALNLNDEIQSVISKYEDMNKSFVLPQESERAIIPVVAVEETEDLSHVVKEVEENVEEVDDMIRKRSKEIVEGIMNMVLIKWISVRNLLDHSKQLGIGRKNSYTKMIMLLSE